MGALKQFGLFQRLIVLTRSIPRGSHRYGSSNAAQKIRNVGIMAHIDAGKTTTTERMLYYAGYTSHLGEVHDGDTVMDYMEQERDRGITIQSAAITFPWKDHQVNLIDTPGHVDFTIEVERALRVLDGGVVVLDGSAGVEAQTMTVWRQAQRNAVPRIAFVNKMDKPNCNWNLSLESIQKRLNRRPLFIQKPIGIGKSFTGLLDLVEQSAMIWDSSLSEKFGRNFKVISFDSPDCPKDLSEEGRQGRMDLIGHLSDVYPEIAEKVLTEELVSNDLLKQSLRAEVLDPESQNLVTLCGSAYKNIGVQPLMDGIVDYLPSPKDMKYPFLKIYGTNFCGLVFKIIHDPNKGALNFVRVYQGRLEEGTTIYNMTRGTSEKVTQLMVAFADDFKAVSAVEAGNIAVIGGLRETFTGDTLVPSSSRAKQVVQEWKKDPRGMASPYLSGISVPNPVFYCSIEPIAVRFQTSLDKALANLVREDPSLHVNLNKETGQTVLSGMGELHLEIIRDRIHKEYKVETDLGELMIAYRETPSQSLRQTVNFEKKIYDTNIVVNIDLSLKVGPRNEIQPSSLKFSKNKDDALQLEALKPFQVKALWKGYSDGIEMGPILGYPVLNAFFTLHSVELCREATPPLISAAMGNAMNHLMQASSMVLLEPIMRLDITVEKEAMPILNQDILRRRGTIENTDLLGELNTLTAFAPLAELRGYSNHVRTITSGKAFFGMEFSHYESMSEVNQKKAIEDVTGFAPI